MSLATTRRWDDLLLNVVYFREAIERIGDADRFVAKHRTTAFDAQQEVAAAERFFERVCNLAVELAKELLKLERPDDSRDIDQLSADSVLALVGRIGIIAPKLGGELDDLREERNVLQHEYSLAPPRSVWRGMETLNDDLVRRMIVSFKDAFARHGIELQGIS